VFTKTGDVGVWENLLREQKKVPFQLFPQGAFIAEGSYRMIRDMGLDKEGSTKSSGGRRKTFRRATGSI